MKTPLFPDRLPPSKVFVTCKGALVESKDFRDRCEYPEPRDMETAVMRARIFRRVKEFGGMI